MDVFGDNDRLEEYGTAHSDETDIEGVVILGYDAVIDKWMALEWSKQKTIWLASGGKEGSELFKRTATRELREETGYSNFKKQVQLGGPTVSHYYNEKKDLYRRSYSFAFLFMLDSTVVGKQALEEHERFIVTWLDYDVLRREIQETGGGVEHWLAVLAKAHDYVTQSGTAA